MNAEEPQADDESILTHLVACDEALAAGKLPHESSDTDPPREQRPRLEGDLAFIQVLRKVLPRRSTGATPGAPPAQGPPFAATDLPFQELGHFQIRRRLGQGAFGIVFLAFDPRLGREVALKVPRPEALLTGELRERFLREARAAAGLDHPNLVPLYEAGTVGPLCYIASAYCPGVTLSEWLKERTELPPERLAAALVARLADAVGHAHSRGVIHRDLKPSNVLLQGRRHDAADANSTLKEPLSEQSLSGTELELIPRITDFGLAKLIGDGTAQHGDGDSLETRTGAVLGTPNYMAPEQASGKNKAIGPAADVYALGGILYELLTGRVPFRGESLLDTLEQVRTREPVPPARLHPKLSRDLETICLKCLEKEPHKRYETAAALAEDLRRYQAGEPIQARPIRTWERGLKWARRRPALAMLWVVGTLAPLIVAGITLAFNVKLVDAKDQLMNSNNQLENSNNQLKTTTSKLKDTNARLETSIDDLAKSNSQLGKKNQELNEARNAEKSQRQRAEKERDRAEQGQREARNFSYVSDMNLTQQDWLTGRAERMKESLERQLPPPGLADLRGFEWYYWRRLLEQKPLEAHKGSVLCVACSPDGKLIASGGRDRIVRLWDAATGRQLEMPSNSFSFVTAVAFADGGRTLLAARIRGMVEIFDVKTRKLSRTLRQPIRGSGPDRILAAAVAPRQQLLALALSDGNVEIWALGKEAKRLIVCPYTEGGAVLAVAFSADGKLLASGGLDGVVNLWDAATGNRLSFYAGPKKGITGISFDPLGDRLATASEDGAIRLWDRDAAKPRAVLTGHVGGVQSVQFAADGKTLVSGGADATVRVWDAFTRKLRLVLRGHSGGVCGVTFTPDGKTIVSASEDGSLRLWDANPEYFVRHGHNQPVTQLAITPDGRELATGAADGFVKFWETATARQKRPPLFFDKPIQGLAFAPDGEHLAVVCSDTIVHICDRQTAKEVARLQGHQSQVQSVAFSRDGALVASGDNGGSVRIWDWKTKKTIAECTDRIDDIQALAFSPDGKLLASSGFNHVINFWEPATGRRLKSLPGHEKKITGLAFSHDGRTLASCGEDGKVYLWDVATGKLSANLKGHAGAVASLAFSPDGRTLASSSGEVKLWHTATRRELATFTVPGYVLNLAWKPSGHLLVGVGQDEHRRGIIMLWQADTKAK